MSPLTIEEESGELVVAPVLSKDGVAELTERSDRFARLMLASNGKFAEWFAEKRQSLTMREVAELIKNTYGVDVAFATVRNWEQVLLRHEGGEEA